jgi:hypothetical protein
MTSLRDDASALYGAWRLACFDRGGIAWFDRSVSGFWRSFRAGAMTYPAFLILLGLRLADAEPAAADPLRLLLVATIGYVISWTAFPLVMLPVTRFLGREPRWLDFIIAYNWSQVVQYALLLASAGLAESALLPDALAISIIQAAFLAVLVYEWFIARAALDISGLAATMIVLVDLVLTAILGRVTSFLS